MNPPRLRILMLSRADAPTFGLHLLAYAKAFPGAEYSLLTYGDEDAGAQVVRDLCEECGVTVVTPAMAQGAHFDVILRHSYVDRETVAGLVAGIDHDEIWYYSDLARNGFIFSNDVDLTRSVLVYFGWELVDRDVTSEARPGPRETHVVPLASIAEVWSLVARRVDDVLEPPLADDTLFIAMRYWGNTSVYQTRRPESMIDAVTDLTIPEGVSRIVVKHDPRSLLSEDDVVAELAQRLGGGMRIDTWRSRPEVRRAVGSLDVLDLYLFAGQWLEGYFFGFDGTPNVLVGATQPRAKLLWPDVGRLDTYFIDPVTVSHVVETVRWQKDIVSQCRAGDAPMVASYSGEYFRTLFDHHLTLDDALERGLLPAVLDHLAQLTGLAPGPFLDDLVIRLNGLKRDRLHYERLWHAHARAAEMGFTGSDALVQAAVAEAVAAAAAREEAHLAEAVAAAAAREEAHLAEAVAAAAAREEAHLAEHARAAAASEASLLSRIADLESQLAAVHGSFVWRSTHPLRRTRGGGPEDR